MTALGVERDAGVFRVTLARPERRNAFDAGLIRELTDAFADVGDARAVVLAGDGPSFCAGADVEWQRSSIDLTFEENVEDAHRLYRMCEAIDRCPAPVVAQVQGYALGGGSGLVACADVAVAGEDAVFGFSEVRLGIIPSVISPPQARQEGPELEAVQAGGNQGEATRRRPLQARQRLRLGGRRQCVDERHDRPAAPDLAAG